MVRLILIGLFLAGCQMPGIEQPRGYIVENNITATCPGESATITAEDGEKDVKVGKGAIVIIQQFGVASTKGEETINQPTDQDIKPNTEIPVSAIP